MNKWGASICVYAKKCDRVSVGENRLLGTTTHTHLNDFLRRRKALDFGEIEFGCSLCNRVNSFSPKKNLFFFVNEIDMILMVKIAHTIVSCFTQRSSLLVFGKSFRQCAVNVH